VKLISFQVTNFRSVNDSGPINVGKVTTLVGRNESGKTNLLLALHSLNPPGGARTLSAIKDFPRGRRMSECSAETPVVDTVWRLETEEQTKLAALFPRAKGVTEVSMGRRYTGETKYVGLQKLNPIQFDHRNITSKFATLKGALQAAAEKLELGPKSQLQTAIANAEAAVSENADPDDWAAAAQPVLTALRQALSSSGAALAIGDPDSQLLKELESLTADLIEDDKAYLEARKWVITRLPIFVYVDEYPELDGHENLDEYVQRKTHNQRTTADLNFEKLCKVADLNPEQLRELLAKNDHETRSQLANRAGAVVTGEIRRLWKDRALKVRFNPDAAHLDTLISAFIYLTYQ